MASDAAESCYHKICTDIDISGFGCGSLNPQEDEFQFLARLEP